MYKVEYANGTTESFETIESYRNTMTERYIKMKRENRLNERQAYTLTKPDGTTMEILPL